MSSKSKVHSLNRKFILLILILICSISIGAAKEPFETEAGLCAYVNVGSPINIDDAMEAFSDDGNLEDFSSTHAVGTFNVMNGDGTSNAIHVYVDSAGWIAAYLTQTESAGLLVQYADMDYADPVVHTTLEDAIELMCDEIGVSYDTVDENIKFYDFANPEATDLTIVLKVLNDEGANSEEMKFLIPSTYTVHRSNFGIFRHADDGYGTINLYNEFSFIL